MLRHRKRSMLLAGACLLAACANGGGAGDTLPPTTRAAGPAPATTPPASSTTTIQSTTSGAPSSVVTSTTVVATTVAPALQLSAGGPWHRVDSAPGITTPGLVYELMPKLWVYLPTKQDLEHGIVWTLHNPDDIPVIEAYLQAQMVHFQAATSEPIDTDLPGWRTFFVDGGEVFLVGLREHKTAGEHVEANPGVVLRPEVIGDNRSDTSAMIFDCMLDGGYYVKADGSLAAGSTYSVVRAGFATRLAMVDGHWMVAQVGSEPSAC